MSVSDSTASHREPWPCCLNGLWGFSPNNHFLFASPCSSPSNSKSLAVENCIKQMKHTGHATWAGMIKRERETPWIWACCQQLWASSEAFKIRAWQQQQHTHFWWLNYCLCGWIARWAGKKKKKKRAPRVTTLVQKSWPSLSRAHSPSTSCFLWSYFTILATNKDSLYDLCDWSKLAQTSVEIKFNHLARFH